MTKARGRGPGEGSIYQRQDGRWVAALNLGYDAKGKRRRKYLYGDSFAEVSRALTKAKKDQHDGLPIVTKSQTVDQHLAFWLEEVARPRLRPTTYQSYESYLRVHIRPALGRHRLDKLEPKHVQAFLNAKQKDGLTPRTVQYMRQILRSALSQAVRWGMVGRNVAALADPPRSVEAEMRYLTPDEAGRLLKAAKGSRLEALYTVAVSLGLRQGEAFGLRWSDVDLDKHQIRVTHTLQRIKGRPVFAEPKTKLSRRTVPLPAPIAAALKAHRGRQLEERLKAGPRWVEWDLVFCTPIGTPLDPRNTLRDFVALLDRAGLPRMRFHDLRHTAATLLHVQGVPARTIMELLGHSQLSMTSRYTHVPDELKREAAERMGALLFPEGEVV